MNYLFLHKPYIKRLLQANWLSPPGREGQINKLLMRMALVTFMMTFLCVHLLATGRAQGISILAKQEPLASVFSQIEKQTGYGFFYEELHLKNANRVTLALSNVTLAEALKQCFLGQPLQYEIVDKVIVVKPKPKGLLNRAAAFIKALRISGRVVDEQGNAISGASVKLKGGNVTVVTDAEGKFSIEVSDNMSVLIVSYLGMGTVETGVKDTNLNIVLKEDRGMLQAVTTVNTGFQNIPKERATGSFATVTQQQLERQITPDIISRLEGITSGLVFNKDFQGNRQIRIRGQNTIFANAEPLIVVDNFPYEGAIDNINPNDIESITVSKDAGAASIWGVRAGNGVIVITTKKGKLNQPLNIGLTSNLTIGGRPDIYYKKTFLNSNDFIDVEQQLFAIGYYNSAENAIAKTPLSPVVELLIKKRDNPSQASMVDAEINALRNVDVRDALYTNFYQNSLLQQYALNFNGGTDNVTYFLSSGADLTRGNTIGQSMHRYTINAQSNYRPIKNLEINASINYIQSIGKTDNTLSQMPVDIDPYTKLQDENGNHLPIVNTYRSTFVDNASSKGFLNWQFIPLDEIGRHTTTSKMAENRLMAAVKYTVVKGLNAEMRYQFQKQSTSTDNFANGESFFSRNLINRYSTVNSSGNVTLNNIPQGGILTFGNDEIVANNFRAQLNYDQILGDHSITGLAGYEIREIGGDILKGRFYGYNPDISTISKVNYGLSSALQPSGTSAIPYNDFVNKTVNRFFSYFANGAYTFKQRYSISGSGRVDASNFFGLKTNQKMVPLWSVGGKWDLSNEAFFDLKLLSKLSLRTTYGFNGNLDKSLSAFTTARYFSGAPFTNATYATIPNPPNPELRWERTSQLNFGLDFTIKNNILNGSIDYYQKRGKDMIGEAEFAPSTGITAMKGNYANINGKGVEAVFNSNILNGGLSWTSTILYNYATDRVTYYQVQVTNQNLVQFSAGSPLTIYPKTGYPVYGLFSYRWGGLNPVNGDPQGFINGALSSNYAALINPVNFGDIVYSGPSKPVHSGGFQNTFSYKKITLSFTLNYKLGYYFRPTSVYFNSLINSGSGYEDFSNRWLKPGDELNTNVPSFYPAATAARDLFYNNSEILVEKGDHIRLQDINLNYTFSRSTLARLPFRSLQLMVYARNLGIVWRENKKGFDPDFYQAGFIPDPKSISVGFRTNF